MADKKDFDNYSDDRTPEGLRLQSYRRFKQGVDYQPVEAGELTPMVGLILKAAEMRQSGRPPIFETVEELQGAIQAFWEYIIEVNMEKTRIIPDVEGVCTFLSIGRYTLTQWEREDFRGFAPTIRELKNNLAYCKKQLALNGKIPPLVFAIDFNNNHGYTQRQEVVIEAKNPLGDAPSQDELREKLLEALPDDGGGLDDIIID